MQTSLEIAENLVHLKSLCFSSIPLVSSLLHGMCLIEANPFMSSFEGFCESWVLVSAQSLLIRAVASTKFGAGTQVSLTFTCKQFTI